jgi:2-methylisocitrate lyase-like PEP mutase family enzyme
MKTREQARSTATAEADVLFAPGPHEAEKNEALGEGFSQSDFNLLVVGDIDLSLREIADLGVRRISVGGVLALADLPRHLAHRL